MIDINTVFGLIIGAVMLLVGYFIDGGILRILWLPSALIMVLGGTIGSTMMSYGFSQVKMLPKLLYEAFSVPKSNVTKTIDYLVNLSDIARKEGLLSLEKVINEDKSINDPFIKKSVLLILDGTGRNEISDILGNEIDIYKQKKLLAIGMFDTMATYAPAFGMIGTIMGLMMLLQDMTSVEAMTKGIAVAFVTTLYGSMMANMIFLPISQKLKNRVDEYCLEKEMVIEAVCAIRDSINPRLLREKLSMYLQFETKKKKVK